MSNNRQRGNEARAFFKNGKEPSDAMQSLARAQAAEQAKTARLRALRLAKEAVDREEAAAKVAAKKPAARKPGAKAAKTDEA